MTGAVHAHGMEAVTAEGLFRAALDKINHSPFSVHNLGYVTYDIHINDLRNVICFTVVRRHQHEKARVLNAYGKLLLKWDKRENAGNDMLKESERVLASLPKFGFGNINSFVNFPQ